MQAETSRTLLKDDLDSTVDLDLPTSSPPPFHTYLPSTDSATSSARSSPIPEETPETTPDGSVIVETPTATSTDAFTSSPTTITNISIPIPPIPPIPSNSTLSVPLPTAPRRQKSTGILMTSNPPRVRSTSLPGSSSSEPELILNNANIKFAPLPELAPRRRKSNVPLGVAARGELMRKRRQMMYGYSGDENGSPMWTERETEIHLRRQMEAQERRRMSLMQAMQEEEEKLRGEEDVEDPFVALGRMMKGAWRKMSGKEKAKSTAAGPSDDGSPSSSEKAKESEEKVEVKVDKTGNATQDSTESGTQYGSSEQKEKDWEIETIVDQ